MMPNSTVDLGVLWKPEYQNDAYHDHVSKIDVLIDLILAFTGPSLRLSRLIIPLRIFLLMATTRTRFKIPRLSWLLSALTCCGSCNTVPITPSARILEMPSVDSLSARDFDFLNKVLAHKKVVLLGESIHLTSEFSKVRRVMIENLHRSNGFNLLLFEGSPLEFWIAQEDFNQSDKGDNAVLAFQKTALFDLWQTNEINLVLRDALASSPKSEPLFVSSYDVQIGQGRRFTQGASVFREFVERLKARRAKMTASVEKNILSLDRLAFCKKKKFPASKDEFEQAMLSISQLEKIVSNLKVEKHADPHDTILTMLPQLLTYSLEFCREVNSSQRNYTELRDEWASKQFISLTSRLGLKSIVWAHSNHVRLGPGPNGRTSLGGYVKRKLGEDVFALTMVANKGSAIAFMDASGNEIEWIEKPLLHTEKLTFETKLGAVGATRDFYLPTAGNKGFLTQRETTRFETEIAVPLDPLVDYDAYYFVQEVHPPALNL